MAPDVLCAAVSGTGGECSLARDCATTGAVGTAETIITITTNREARAIISRNGARGRVAIEPLDVLSIPKVDTTVRISTSRYEGSFT
jgi:hypothetical protein